MKGRGNVEEKRRGGAARTAWMVVYSVGNVGYELMYEFFKNFQNFFLTDICHFSTALTGTAITVINILKAVFTPISGMIIDKNPFRARDKHTPWIIGMPLFLGILFIAMAFTAWKGGQPRTHTGAVRPVLLPAAAAAERLPQLDTLDSP